MKSHVDVGDRSKMKMTTKQVLKHLNISKTTLRNWVKEFKIPRQKKGGKSSFKKDSIELLESIKTLRDENKSFEEIHVHLNEAFPDFQYDIPEEVAEESSEEVAEESSEEVAEESSEEVAEESSEEVAEESPEEVAEESSEEVAEESPEEVAEESPEEVAEESPEEVAEESPEEVVEESSIEDAVYEDAVYVASDDETSVETMELDIVPVNEELDVLTQEAFDESSHNIPLVIRHVVAKAVEQSLHRQNELAEKYGRVNYTIGQQEEKIKFLEEKVSDLELLNTKLRKQLDTAPTPDDLVNAHKQVLIADRKIKKLVLILRHRPTRKEYQALQEKMAILESSQPLGSGESSAKLQGLQQENQSLREQLSAQGGTSPSQVDELKQQITLLQNQLNEERSSRKFLDSNQNESFDLNNQIESLQQELHRGQQAEPQKKGWFNKLFSD